MRNSTRPILFVALLVGLLLPPRVGAQEIFGRVLDAATEDPLDGLRVLLLHEGDEVVASAITDGDGRFTVTPADPGTYTFYLAPPGSAEVRTAGIRVRLIERVEVELRVSTSEPVANSLAIITRSRQVDRLARDMRAFRIRVALDREERVGRVLGREELAETPWLSVGSFWPSRFPEAVEEGCRPSVYVDGRSGPAIDDRLMGTSVAGLEGLEYHPGAGIADSRFVSPDGCGVLVAWTRDWEANRIFTWGRFVVWAGAAALSLLLLR